jgi:hypothetical protein
MAPVNWSGDGTTFSNEYVSPFMVHMNITGSDTNSLEKGAYYAPGLIRKFARNVRALGGFSISMNGSSSSYSNRADLIVTDFTYPVNSVLYFGCSAAGDLYGKSWQGNSNGTTTYSTTNAAQLATKDVCAKLKSDHGNNLRIYVVKFRKQEKYKTFPFRTGTEITQTNVSHNYSYIDDCASEASYVHDATTETTLKSALDAIATDIKSWAEYKDAKLLE